MSEKKHPNLTFFKRPINKSLFKIEAKEVGLPPGTLVHVGEHRTEKPVISLIDYSQTVFETDTNLPVAEAAKFKNTDTVSWINLSGIHDVTILEQLGQKFNVHSLALEDILNTQHRPKLEDFDDFSLIIIKMMLFDEKIGGTIHIAVGDGFPECGSKNKSAIHWDMLCDMAEGEIIVDGELFYKNGKFVKY